MKKRIPLLLLGLPLIASCGGMTIPEEDSFIAAAIEAYRENSYVVDTNWTTEILRKDVNQTYQPLSIRRTENYNLAYQLTGDRAIKVSANTKHEDLYYEDGEYNVINTSYYSTEDAVYYRDDETGFAIVENLTIDNEVTQRILSDYDSNESTYTPIDFDSEFKNPFDYLQASDFKKADDGTYLLDGTKAVFLAKCFQRTSLTYSKDATVSFDDEGRIASITINIDKVDAENYTQESTYTCVFSDVGNVNIKRIAPYSYSNPDLEALFAKMKNAQSYTYFKAFGDKDAVNGYDDDVTCFYTQDAVFFHHSYDEYPNAIYTGGYDYDYKVVYDDEEGKYYSYEYNKANDNAPYAWALCYLSGSTPLTYATFQDIGPTFYEMSPSLFYPNEDGSYSVVDEFLSTVGAYFDNQFIGVHSDVLDGACTAFKLVLDGTDGFTAELTYESENEEHEITFALSAIDATDLPFEI